ncbi:MAG: hypothetical protein ACLQIB_45480 [Isosphaeraceae bacterium]
METLSDSRDCSGDPRPAAPAGQGHESSEAARPLLARPARGFVRFLYSSNPFYILSADLVFVGLRISFGSGSPASHSWALAIGLAGYTLLLATTACFLIRVGKLWDDLRSLLILIALIFLAMATSFDDTMAADPWRGSQGYLGGFAFAVVVSEVVLRTIRLRLRGWYRAAYYAILAVVFLYPIVLVPVLSQPESPRLQWALFGFSPLAALALLLLVPAARGGPEYVADNGSPWRWPLFPWSLFLVMAGGVGLRCYSLCLSFHYVEGSRTIFGPYFLIPIGLAAAQVWLEIAIAARRRGVMVMASMVPLALVLLAPAGFRYEPVYLHFLDLFRETLGGSPFFVALVAAAVFHAYAIVRRVPIAWELLTVDLAVLAVVGPKTNALHEIAGLRPLPLAAAGLVLGIVAWRGRRSGRAMVAASLIAVAMAQGCADIWPIADGAPIALHLVIVAFLIVGALFDDWLGRLARISACVALLLLGVFATVHLPSINGLLPAKLIPWYPLCIVAATSAYALLVRNPYLLPTPGCVLAIWAFYSVLENYAQFRRVLTGLDQIVLGLVFFLIAAAISLRKAGLWPRSGGPIGEQLRGSLPETIRATAAGGGIAGDNESRERV